ncbi:hypothetical protein HPG69_018355, partial [Diceros bicornis minor]
GQKKHQVTAPRRHVPSGPAESLLDRHLEDDLETQGGDKILTETILSALITKSNVNLDTTHNEMNIQAQQNTVRQKINSTSMSDNNVYRSRKKLQNHRIYEKK